MMVAGGGGRECAGEGGGDEVRLVALVMEGCARGSPHVCFLWRLLSEMEVSCRTVGDGSVSCRTVGDGWACRTAVVKRGGGCNARGWMVDVAGRFYDDVRCR